MWEPLQATSDIDMYWVGPVYVRCDGKGTAPGCAQKREPKGTKRPRTNPALKWQLRSRKYTCSLPCSLTEQSYFQTTSVPATSGDHSVPMEIEETGRDATSASSSAARVSMDVDSAAAKGPSTTEGAAPIPRELANDILATIPLLPDEWPLAKVDLILQNTDKYYMSWRRFLYVHELLRTFDEESAVAALRANTTSLVEPP